MNKRIIIIIIILGILLLAIAVFLIYKITNNPKPAINQVTAPAVYRMSGKITQVKEHSIVIEGKVGTTTKAVEFSVDSNTLIRKIGIAITADQLKSGKPFQPKQIQSTGNFSDLTLNSSISLITSKQDISKNDSVTAFEIILTNYDLPKTNNK